MDNLAPSFDFGSPSQEKNILLLARGWKSVDGYERYLVSNSGLIYSSIIAGIVSGSRWKRVK